MISVSAAIGTYCCMAPKWHEMAYREADIA